MDANSRRAIDCGRCSGLRLAEATAVLPRYSKPEPRRHQLETQRAAGSVGGGAVSHKAGRISAFTRVLPLFAIITLTAARVPAQTKTDASVGGSPDLAQAAIPVESLPRLPEIATP